MEANKEHLHFPPRLRLQLVEEEHGLPVRKVAVTLRVFALQKNHYDLGPPLSNEDGFIVISRDWVEGAIEYYRNTFIMDYATPLEQCSPQVRIKVLSPDEITLGIRAMRLYRIENGGAEVARTVNDLLNARNSLYIPREVYITLDRPNTTMDAEVRIALRPAN